MAIPKFLKMLSGRIREAAMTALEVTDTLGYVPREKLSAARTYYVRTDGNDANTGLVNNSGGAFLTIQKAVDVASAVDNGGYAITIQVGAGTYSSFFSLRSYVGSGTMTLRGDASTPANCVIAGASYGILGQSVLGAWVVDGFKFTTSTVATVYLNNAVLELKNIDFGAPSTYHLYITGGSSLKISSNYTISASANNHILCDASRIENVGYTVTLSGTPAFNTFIVCRFLAFAYMSANTYSGSATGVRYVASMNSVIQCGGSATYFPGNASGSVVTGGQYA